MNTKTDSTAAPSKATEPAEVMAAIKQLEADICDVLYAATAAGSVLSDLHVQRVEDGRHYTFEIDRLSLDTVIFAQSETERRARDLVGNFYAAIEGGAK